MRTAGHSSHSSSGPQWTKFVMAVSSAYALATIALSLTTLITLTHIGTHWSPQHQQLATLLTLTGSAAVMLLPTTIVVTRQLRSARRAQTVPQQSQFPIFGSIALAYGITVLVSWVMAFAVILPQRDLHRAPTQHQARAEIEAERYLKEHHAEVSWKAFTRAFDEEKTPPHLRDEIASALLRNPKGAICVASENWRTEGVQCFQNYFTSQPMRFFIKAPIYVEMRDNAPPSEPAAPEAVSAHVQVQGVFVSAAAGESE